MADIVKKLPHTPLFPKRTTKGLAALWTLAEELIEDIWGFLAYVIGMDVRNGSVEHSVFILSLS